MLGTRECINNMIKLKPCRCKKEPEYFVKNYGFAVEYIYVCPICNKFGVGYTDEEAREDWNKRS